MPFKEPWREFEPGDLVYGINKTQGRKGYIDNGPFKQTGNDRKPRTIDEYPILKSEVDPKREAKVAPSEAERNFGIALRASKYTDAVHGPDTNAATRRKDKGGLYWATMVERKHVHFVLDGIDLKAVVEKNYGGDPTTGGLKTADSKLPGKEKNRSITGSELRWIYRQRAHPGVQEYIQFWFDRKPCRPPWESYVAGFEKNGKPKWAARKDAEGLWAHYQPRSLAHIQRDIPYDGSEMPRLERSKPGKKGHCQIL
jgi:hypothetical protein